MLKSIALSTVLLAIYASGNHAWILGFVALAPWLLSLQNTPSLRQTLLSGYLMSVAFTLAGFHWFGRAIGDYTGLGAWTGLALLLALAPLFQPQIMLYALVRWLAGRRYGVILSSIAGAAAWVACERLLPKMLGDTLSHGLYPAEHLRMVASLTGTAGLTLALLLVNSALALAWANLKQRSAHQSPWQTLQPPLAAAATLLLLLQLLGWYGKPGDTTSNAASSLKVGLIQSNLTRYEDMRRELGPYEATRKILDTHYAMSYDAVERQKVDAVLWSETVYPTTFLHPKSQTGAELDQEILGIIRSAQTPFVLGTYDRDAQGEYNAAAIVSPQKDAIGMYRKSRLFPFTEYLPRWLDWPVVRQALPWTGRWLPGDGARVFPLTLRDGREIPIQPLICLDDTDSQLALDGARLGAQALFTLSNDSWFTAYPQGARLHQAVAAFRSIETGLPQFRVTTNGYSAVIDPRGQVIASAKLGEQTLVVGALPANARGKTLLVQWGNWPGLVCAVFLALLGVTTLLPQRPITHKAALSHDPAALNAHVTVSILPPLIRWITSGLRGFARIALLLLAINLLLDANLRSNVLAQMRLAGSLILLPELMALVLLHFYKAKLLISQGNILLDRGKKAPPLTAHAPLAAAVWRLPLPTAGITLTFAEGNKLHLAVSAPHALTTTLQHFGMLKSPGRQPPRWAGFLAARELQLRTRLSHPIAKFVVFPLLLALPAFRLHQHIAYGHTFGEYYTFGLKAYLTTLGLWWATWAIGVVATVALLRVFMEGVAILATVVRPQTALDQRYLIERMGLVALYLGMPLWLALRIVGNL